MQDTLSQNPVSQGMPAHVETVSPMVRVAMLIQSYHPWIGGAERQVEALCSVFPHQGIEALVITRRRPEPGYTPFEIIAGAPVYRIRIFGGYALRSLSFTAGALWQLWKLRRQIDVLHAHDTLSPTTTALLAKFLIRRPVVVKVLTSGSLGDIAVLRAKRFGRARMALLARFVDRFICISDEIANDLTAAGVALDKLARIPNGVDTIAYAPTDEADRQRMRQQVGVPAEAPVAIFTGRLIPKKGLRDLAAAWASVVEQQPNAHLLIVGTGPEAEVLQAMSAPNVHLLGARQDIPDLLRASDIFVLPSQAEGLSNALLEAMASGLACVGSDVGGTRDLLQHERNGVLVPYGDQPALARELIRLISNSHLRRALGSAARQTIERDYSLESVAQRLRALYTDIMDIMPPR